MFSHDLEIVDDRQKKWRWMAKNRSCETRLLSTMNGAEKLPEFCVVACGHCFIATL